MTVSISDFLEARLTEDEAAARAAAVAAESAEWETGTGSETHGTVWASPKGMHRTPLADGPVEWDPLDPAVANHMTVHDPARVLREVAAKRKIIELADEASCWDMTVDTDRRVGSRDTTQEPYVGDLILRQLAQAYVDHPDFNPEWSIT